MSEVTDQMQLQGLMVFSEIGLIGAFVIDIERKEDDRGFFARTFCEDEFRAHGVSPRLVQCNVSFNKHRGTLRGMHWQASPCAESKLVHVTSGAIFDVIIDLRPTSATFKQHFGVELTAQNRRALYVPEGFAHGFQTLEDDTEVFYQMTASFSPESSRGVCWNDPAFGIRWPDVEKRIVSARDAGYPGFEGNR